MNKTVVTYETFHGSAKKVAEVIANHLNCDCINIDTPFEVEDLQNINNIILVFNFRGPYTAQLTKLYLNRVKDQIKTKNVILVGEGLFSEKEFPIVAEEINKIAPSKTFNKFFVNGQLRVDTLSREERILLDKFSEITGMKITDMGNLDLDKAINVAKEIKDLINSKEFKAEAVEVQKSETTWTCLACGYTHNGDNPPEQCPICGMPKDIFRKN